jgi:hypothetical protein
VDMALAPGSSVHTHGTKSQKIKRKGLSYHL